MEYREVGETLKAAFNEPLIEIEDYNTRLVAIKVNANTNAEILENVKLSIEQLLRQSDLWPIQCIENGSTILQYLKENPLEMLYDPEDDLSSESFELDRFVAV